MHVRLKHARLHTHRAHTTHKCARTQEEEVERRAAEVERLREEVASLGARASALGEMAAPLESKLLAAKERVEAAEKAVRVSRVRRIRPSVKALDCWPESRKGSQGFKGYKDKVLSHDAQLLA